jgi:hypothetical protein
MTDVNGKPDRYFAADWEPNGKLKERPLKLVAIELLDALDQSVLGLEETGAADLESFFEDMVHADHFSQLQEFAGRLGLSEQFLKILTQYKNIFDLGKELLRRTSMSQAETLPITKDELSRFTTGYKNFSKDLRALFESFNE